MAKKKKPRRAKAKSKHSESSRKIKEAAASVRQAASEIARHANKIALHVEGIASIVQEEPVGSCIYVDSQGQLQCEGPVTQSYCSSIAGGHFRPGGRCSA